MRSDAEIALLNTRLTERERAAQLASIERIPPSGEAATILFTSGTTGAAKAVFLSRENHLASARAAVEVLGIDRRSKFICCLPLFHVGGLAIVFRCDLAGAELLLHERFDAHAVARDLLSGATHVSLVASTLARLLEVCERFPSTVRAALVGGGPVPAPLFDKACRAGLPILQTYGLTETASMATCEREPDGTTAGPPMPGMELRIVEGEIEVRGPAVMRGYLGQEPVRGWFKTGDLGELDARGRLIVHARRSDLIISGGENVYPAEVEAALLSHPRVREAAVLPAPDERWGQIGVAYVATDAAESELRAFLGERIARYKVPARFVMVPELPRTAAGKIDRVTLAARTFPGTT
ncbi:MAG: 2-succinylbenzoate--CoA ligase [Deltaproteobacteria bacterium]|nr:MAG: 2-succinylbenzoate--CoA ligase [Deltaproteobacteria bacterium]